MNAGIWAQIDACLVIIMQKVEVSICKGMFVSVSALQVLVACYYLAFHVHFMVLICCNAYHFQQMR